MELLYLFYDKRKTNIQLKGWNFVQEGALELDVCQAKTDNSYVSLKTIIDYIHTDRPFYLLC